MRCYRRSRASGGNNRRIGNGSPNFRRREKDLRRQTYLGWVTSTLWFSRLPLRTTRDKRTRATRAEGVGILIPSPFLATLYRDTGSHCENMSRTVAVTERENEDRTSESGDFIKIIRSGRWKRINLRFLGDSSLHVYRRMYIGTTTPEEENEREVMYCTLQVQIIPRRYELRSESKRAQRLAVGR